MNKDRQSPKRRSYDNTHRLEQAKQTRERILDSAVKVIDGDGWKEASLSAIARAAGVSEPTLYRHFGTRERLLEELEAHAQAKLGFPGFPGDLDQLAKHVGTLFGKFDEHGAYLRASLQSGFGREIRERGRAGRLKRLRGLVESISPDLGEVELEQVTGVVRVLASWESYDTLTREMGLSSQAASEAISWALTTLLTHPTVPGAVPDEGASQARTNSMPRKSSKKSISKKTAMKNTATKKATIKEKRP